MSICGLQSEVDSGDQENGIQYSTITHKLSLTTKAPRTESITFEEAQAFSNHNFTVTITKMTEVPDLSGPGILLAATYITDPALSDKTFNKWYNEIHIPDVIATGGISQATRFRNANPDATEKYLAIYHVPDLSIVTSEKFQKIPDKHEMLPDGRSIREVVNMEVRFYKLVQVDPESQDQDGE